VAHAFHEAERLGAEYLAREGGEGEGLLPEADYAELFGRIAGDDLALAVALRTIHAGRDLLHSRAEVSDDELAGMISAALRGEDPFAGAAGPDHALYCATLAYEAARRFMVAAAPAVHHCPACQDHACYGCRHETPARG
jgi:hypothetical protein